MIRQERILAIFVNTLDALLELDAVTSSLDTVLLMTSDLIELVKMFITLKAVVNHVFSLPVMGRHGCYSCDYP